MAMLIVKFHKNGDGENTMKVRQDAWSHEDDLLLAETVLRHIRDGGTQLQAFEEVGDHLNRTSAACGFRWNAVVRRKYEQAISLAKKQRKERKRALAKQQAAANERKAYQNPQSFSAFEFGEEYIPLSERKSHSTEQQPEQQSTITTNQTTNNNESNEREMDSSYVTNRSMQSTTNVSTSVGHSAITINDVISFLQNLNHSNSSTQKLQLENERLKQDLQSLLDENENLKRKVKRLEQDQETIQEDYQSLIKIMDRARRMVVFSEDENVSSTSFKMDKNGNLEKIAK
jgi:prespore-specific regulator